MKNFIEKVYRKSKRNKVITIVSGLPRCGTSMMMQMLNAGGMPTVTDNIREADENNPRGYYELEAVKRIKEDKSWLESCYGKAFKMVSLLLFNLPADKTYKVVFMKRDMDEMLDSQRAMLQRLEKRDDGKDKAAMHKNFDKHLSKVTKWLESQPNIDVIYMNYNSIIKKPYNNAKVLSRFLIANLDVKKMAQVVEKRLYRQRKAETGGGSN